MRVNVIQNRVGRSMVSTVIH